MRIAYIIIIMGPTQVNKNPKLTIGFTEKLYRYFCVLCSPKNLLGTVYPTLVKLNLVPHSDGQRGQSERINVIYLNEQLFGNKSV